jgi:hypothetical protein
MSVVVLVVLIAVLRPEPKVARFEGTSPATKVSTELSRRPAAEHPIEVVSATEVGFGRSPTPPIERPIEEILAEDGEDPGAVFYMSRVREALREGNPRFARELLRQMKEEHSHSILIEEAEALFKG